MGPSHPLRTPSEAAKIAQDGGVIEIAAALDEDDVAIWPQNDLTIRGVGGRAHVRASGQLAEDKGIWVIKGRNATVENAELSGARGPHRDGSGIRGEGIGPPAACFAAPARRAATSTRMARFWWTATGSITASRTRRASPGRGPIRTA